jgi:hypothetical protein
VFHAAPFSATLKTRRDIAKMLFVFDILSGIVSSSPLLTEVGFRVPSYPTRRHEFFHIDNNLFDFNESRNQFVAQLKSD